jgi:hypothetical protein
VNVIDFINYTNEICTYTIHDNIITASTSIGVVHCTVSPDGIYCEELGSTFVLGLAGIVSDGEYIYNPDGEGYGVLAVINTTKTTYKPIKTGINGKPTTFINNLIFRNCTNMTIAPELPDTITTSMPEYRNLTNLVSAVIPKGVSGIIDNMFSECTSLASITIPNNITSIGNHAFSGCSSLTNVIFKGTTAQWNSLDKDQNWNLNVPATYVQCSDGQVALE